MKALSTVEIQDNGFSLFKRKRGYFTNPVIDFLGLGGLSWICMAIFYVIVPARDNLNFLVSWGAALALLINKPHFALSYQFFYEDYKKKVTSKDYNLFLKVGYVFCFLFLLFGF